MKLTLLLLNIFLALVSASPSPDIASTTSCGRARTRFNGYSYNFAATGKCEKMLHPMLDYDVYAKCTCSIWKDGGCAANTQVVGPIAGPKKGKVDGYPKWYVCYKG